MSNKCDISASAVSIGFFEESLYMLKKIYEDEAIEPGNLKFVGVKPQWNVVAGTKGQTGLALNFTGEHAVYENSGAGDTSENQSVQLELIQSKIGKDLFEFAESLLDVNDMQQRSLCLATLNALSNPLTDPDRLQRKGFKLSGTKMNEFVKPDDIVTIIGHGGIVRMFTGKCKELHVSDMRPKETFQTLIVSDKAEYGPRDIELHLAEDNDEIVAKSDIVIITASTLVNDTFKEIVSTAKKARVIGLYGPSAQLSPEILFNYGINFIKSFRIVDHAKFEYDVVNDSDMEVAIKTFQSTYHIYGF
jgi:uncharacterized protein (DUF4213/DUF364 family)